VRRGLVAVLVAVAVAGCSAGQDPGVTPSTDPGPTTTSRALAPCPPGGPDATTPAAGCLDADGAVVRPQP
jgi:hypothetical protein